MSKIVPGILLKAKREMSCYQFDPRNKVPVKIEDFGKMEQRSIVMFISKIQGQETAIGKLQNWGIADLYSFILDGKIVWQAWYHDRTWLDGYFTNSWEVVVFPKK
jgi:hypothetical protein